jgi:hypothetical protein
MKNFISLSFILILFFSTNNYSQITDDWKLSGQIQLRSELDGRDFNNDTYPQNFTSLRTRLGVNKSFTDRVQFFVQFQDSRVFGEEPNTLSAIDNIDLHQGYVTLVKPFNFDLNVQAGRFEVAYGTERFFGAVGWHYVGRAFDGVRFEIAPSSFPVDLFALTVREPQNYIGNAVPSAYPYPSDPATSHSIYGLYKIFNISEKSRLDLLGYYENNRARTNQGDHALKMFTLAGTYSGKYDQLSTIVEAAYQFGKMGAIDIGAYLVSASFDYKMNEISIGAGADLLSGTDNKSSDFNTFQPTYGTNHKFYGYMDYFINIPGNTFFAGLNDFYLRFNYMPKESQFSFAADLHHFISNKPILVTSVQNPDGEEQSTFGQELDLTVRYNFIKGTTITWGGSVFFPSDLMKTLFAPGEDLSFWSYLMITVNL